MNASQLNRAPLKRAGRGRVAWVALAALLCQFAAAPASAQEPASGGPTAELPAAPAGGEESDLARRRAGVEALGALEPGAAVEAALAALGDPDPLVRGRATEFLGRPGLPFDTLGQRIRRIGERLREDPAREVREAAARALGGLDDPLSAEQLDAAFAALPAADHGFVADAFDDLRSADALLAERVTRAMADSSAAPQGPGLAELIEAYGRVLPELPGGGRSAAERAPLLAGFRHPDRQIARAAASGLTAALDRLVWLDRTEGAEALITAFAADGWDARDLDYRGAVLALAAGRDPERALKRARSLQRRCRGDGSAEGLTYRAYGHLLAASAELARRAPAAALEQLAGARASLERALGLRAERLAPAGVEGSESARRAVDRRQLLALVDVLQIGALLLERPRDGAPPDGAPTDGAPTDGAPTDGPTDEHAQARLSEAARRVHVQALRAQLLELQTSALLATASLDAILDRDLSPRRLLGGTRRLPAWTPDELLGWLQESAQVLARAAPEELLGLGGPAELRDPEGAAVAGPLEDPQRLELLKAMRIAQLEYASERASDPDERGNRPLWMSVLQRLSQDIDAEDEAAGFRPLLDYRDPSLLALDLAREWRGEGQPQRAVELLEALRSDVEGVDRPPSANWKDWTQARLSLALGSALSDLGREQEAEAELLASEGRLQALENSLIASRDELRQGRQGPFQVVDSDPRTRQLVENQILGTRRLRSDVLVSLAVNANVQQQDPVAARGYFERAFALQQNEFMTVLAACYRARAGAADDARFLLASIRPSRGLYYNLACTYALLGEPQRALAFLELELEDPTRSPGALARQREWARRDPDLAALVELPEFERLTAPR